MRLSTIFGIGTVALGCVGIIVAGAMIWSTSKLHRGTSVVGETVESVYAAEETEIALLIHNREALLHGLRPDEGHDVRVKEARDQVHAWLDRMQAHSSGPEEEGLAEDARNHVRRFLAIRSEEFLRGHDSLEAYLKAQEALDQAYASLERYTEFNRSQSQALMERAGRLDDQSDMIAGIAATILVATIAAFLVLMRSFIYRPFNRLRHAIAKFGGGDREARAPLRGPTELREVASVFNEMAATLQQQRASQLRFLAGIAHDLRTPMAAIKMAAELLDPEMAASEAERREMAAMIKRQSDQLDRMVGDLLDTTRIEAGSLSLNPKPNDLVALADQAVSLYRSASPRHSVILKASRPSIPCRCDSVRVGQVLSNLVNNAIKYSPNGGEVTVAVEQEQDSAIVSVADQGLGVGEEDKSKIFEPFRRSPAVRDTIPGVGLGLSVSRRIIEAHRGSIEIESRLGAGTTFIVRLPVDTTLRS